MSFALMQDCLDLRVSGLTSSAKFVLVALARFADNEGGNCFPSITLLHEATGLAERAIRNALALLLELGLVTRTRAPGRSYQFQICIPAGSQSASSRSTGSQSTSSRSDTTTGSQSTTTTGGRSAGRVVVDQPDEYINKKPLNKPTEEVSPRPRDFVPEEVENKRTQRKKAQRTKLPYDTIPLQWWIECDKLRPKTFNPWVVFEEFKSYWLSDDAKGNGLKSDWLGTWRNNVKGTRKNDANEFHAFNGEYQHTFESLYRGTPDEAAAEEFFFRKTSIHDFGYGDCVYEHGSAEVDLLGDQREDAKAAGTVRALMGKSVIHDEGPEVEPERDYEFC